MTEIKGNQLVEFGWMQGPIIGAGLKAARALTQHGYTDAAAMSLVDEVRQNPGGFVGHPQLAELAQAWLALNDEPNPIQVATLREQPLPYRAWGKELVESGAIAQMENAARLPIARAAALVPDAHVGYGLPIGGIRPETNTRLSGLATVPGTVISRNARRRVSAASPGSSTGRT